MVIIIVISVASFAVNMCCCLACLLLKVYGEAASKMGMIRAEDTTNLFNDLLSNFIGNLEIT